MKVKIGFEVHLQLATRRKMYCNCPTDYQDVPPNTNVCSICTGMPGAKPLPPNERALDAAIEIALMLGCRIHLGDVIYIQRKHYDYPDLPSGYQRTSLPIASGGELEGARIRELHLEEDPGQYDPVSGTVDYNRSGIPLVEIVTEPDMESPEHARRFLRSLIRVLEYTGKVRPEAGGAMRADVNISMEGGGRVEIKNINSVKGAYRALKYEMMRQGRMMKRGEKVLRETRAYLESQMVTVPMRAKELEEDYRYIPDPDIFPILIDASKVESIRSEMPEPPKLRETRLSRQYGIPAEAAEVIAGEREFADLYEAVARQVDPVLVATWFRTKLKKVLNYVGLRAADVAFTPDQLVGLLKMVKSGAITPEQGELALRALVRSPDDPEKIVLRLGLISVGKEELLAAIEEVISGNAAAVKDYLSGREEALNFLTGRVLAEVGGKADPRTVAKILKRRIRGS